MKKRAIPVEEVRSYEFMYWLPRILMLLFIGFISLFALDVFGSGKVTFQMIGTFFVHLIPSLILTGALITAWNKEKIGGILFLVLGTVFTLYFGTYRDLSFFLAISGPVFITGILFLVRGNEES